MINHCIRIIHFQYNYTYFSTLYYFHRQGFANLTCPTSYLLFYGGHSQESWLTKAGVISVDYRIKVIAYQK